MMDDVNLYYLQCGPQASSMASPESFDERQNPRPYPRLLGSESTF